MPFLIFYPSANNFDSSTQGWGWVGVEALHPDVGLGMGWGWCWVGGAARELAQNLKCPGQSRVK